MRERIMLIWLLAALGSTWLFLESVETLRLMAETQGAAENTRGHR